MDRSTSQINNLRSELLGQISSLRNSSTAEIKSIVNDIFDSKVKELIEEFSNSKTTQNAFLEPKEDSKNFNYYTEGTYQGNTVKFTLAGEVVNPQDEDKLDQSTEFIEFAGGGSDYAFKLYATTTGGQNPQPRIGVIYGEVNEQPPSGMTTSSPFLISPANNATVYLDITFDTGGSVQNTAISSGSSVPSNTETKLYVSLGVVALANNTYSIVRQIHFSGNIIVRKQNVCFDGDPKIDYLFVATKDLIEVQ
jgi:hypothetical protein